MNFFMNEMSQRCGVSIISGSTRSVAIVISGKSVIKFIRSTWPGSRGRNFLRKRDAPAMLNMFPKFALVAMKTYFMVFAKVIRPLFTPSISTSRSFSRRTKSAASFATSTPLSTDREASAACRAGASLMPSPM